MISITLVVLLKDTRLVFRRLNFFFVVLQTAVAVGEDLDDKLPHHEYYEYFGPDYNLHVAPSNMENQNNKSVLENMK